MQRIRNYSDGIDFLTIKKVVALVAQHTTAYTAGNMSSLLRHRSVLELCHFLFSALKNLTL